MLTPHAALSKDKRNADKTTMEHRHFAVIAGIIARLDDNQRTAIAEHFANYLAISNPKFNRARFITACH